MPDRLLLGIDMGSSFTKACLFEVPPGGDVRLRSMHSVPTRLHLPCAGWVEQDPEGALQEVFAAIEGAMAGARGRRPDAVAFSGAMHSLLALDARGRPLGRALTWADQRSARQARRLRAEVHEPPLAMRTGTPVHPMSPLCKLAWMREEEPRTFREAAVFTGLKEYVVARLVARASDSPVMDLSMASGTGLWNLASGTWDAALLDHLGMADDRLPRVVPTDFLVGAASGMAALEGIPVYVGAGDGPLSNLGSGALGDGVGAISVGTSGALRLCTRGPHPDARGCCFTYHLGGELWVTGGAVSDGGIVLDWLRSHLGLGDSTEALLAEAAAAPPGADGLVFLPYTAGARAPHWDVDASGAFVGLRIHHERPHLVRAVLEGIAYGLRDVMASLPADLLPVRELRASGGFTRSDAWIRIMADVLGVPIRVPGLVEPAALGATCLVAAALDGVSLHEEARRWSSLSEGGRCFEPDREAADLYACGFDRYRQWSAVISTADVRAPRSSGRK